MIVTDHIAHGVFRILLFYPQRDRFHIIIDNNNHFSSYILPTIIRKRIFYLLFDYVDKQPIVADYKAYNIQYCIVP